MLQYKFSLLWTVFFRCKYLKTLVWAAIGCGASCCGASHSCAQLTHNSCQVNSCQVNSCQFNSCQVNSCRPVYQTGRPLQTVQPTTASLKATTMEKTISRVYYKLSLTSGRCYRLCQTQSTYMYRVQSSVWCLPNYWFPIPSPPIECVLPPHQRRGYKLARGWGGGGSIFRKTPDIGLASYRIIPLQCQSSFPCEFLSIHVKSNTVVC